MIELAMILSAVIGRGEDFFIIFALWSVNLIVDILQERKDEKVLKALKETLPILEF